MKKYLLTIEFRYYDKPKSDIDSDYKSKKITIGVFDDFDQACRSGNSLMEDLESKFELHVFPKGKGTAVKERFSKNGGCFGGKKNLISNLAYLSTPFDFYAKITTLNYDSVDDTINEVINARKRYEEYRLTDED